MNRDDFMEFFRDTDKLNTLSADDRHEVFAGIMLGSSDFTRKNIHPILGDYNVTRVEVFDRMENNRGTEVFRDVIGIADLTECDQYDELIKALRKYQAHTYSDETTLLEHLYEVDMLAENEDFLASLSEECRKQFDYIKDMLHKSGCAYLRII